MDEDELLLLLQEARERNRKLGVTGMLLYKEGNFMQMLEGERQVILELYDMITKDSRHKDVTKIMTGDIKKRNYAEWSMGFFNMDQAGNFPKYNEYIDQNLTLRSFQDDAKHVYRFITRFNETN